MSAKSSKISTAIFAAAMCTALTANAADAPRSAPENQGNVSYVSGGVGEDEAAALQSAAASYSLQLQFVQKAVPRDEFLADVKIRITDRSQNVVLDTVANGPFLLAKLPSGRYQIEADHNGIVKRRTVDVRGDKHQRAVFVWAASPNDDRQSMTDTTASGATVR
jgi:hypothetical protein